MTTEELYGLNFPVKSLAIANPFVEKVLYKSSYILGQQMTPFCMYANDIQKQYGVVDMATFKGLIDTNTTLLDEIAAYRKDVFKNVGLYLDTTDELKKKYLFYDYLMTVAICYVEIPTYKTKDGIAQKSFDKFFATRNPVLMATWMGMDASAMQIKYSSQININQAMISDNEIRYVKLGRTNKGNKITVPKKNGKIDNMTCIPLFMLSALVDGIKPYLSDRIVEFTFIKDNGTVRVLPATISEHILMDYYHDTNTVASLLSGVDLDKEQQGAIVMSSHMNRGHFKVPEVGLSRYDITGVRSVDVARLLAIKEVKEVNRFFIDVDVDSVVDTFQTAIDQKVGSHPEELPLIYKDIVGKEPIPNMTVTDYVSALYNDVLAKNSILSTKFREELHTYMILHPQYFPDYTGMRVLPTGQQPKPVTSSNGNMNIGFGDDIAFG